GKFSVWAIPSLTINRKRLRVTVVQPNVNCGGFLQGKAVQFVKHHPLIILRNWQPPIVPRLVTAMPMTVRAQSAQRPARWPTIFPRNFSETAEQHPRKERAISFEWPRRSRQYPRNDQLSGRSE